MNELAQPSIRLVPTLVDEARLPVGASKRGGWPDLPGGFAWLVWHSLPPSFLAQFCLADLRPFLAEPERASDQQERGMLGEGYANSEIGP